jgi:hypothetical protein
MSLSKLLFYAPSKSISFSPIASRIILFKGVENLGIINRAIQNIEKSGDWLENVGYCRGRGLWDKCEAETRNNVQTIQLYLSINQRDSLRADEEDQMVLLKIAELGPKWN